MTSLSDSNIDLPEAQLDNQSATNLEIQTNYRHAMQTFRIRGKDYNYNGPVNQETEELIKLLEDMEKSEENDVLKNNTRLGRIIQNYNQINSWLIQRCSFLSGRIQIEITDVLILVFYLIIYFITLGESINISIIDTVRQQIASQLPIYSFLYTLGSLSCQQIKNIYIWLLLFVGLFGIPIFLMLYIYLDLFHTQDIKDYNYEGIGFCIVSIMIFFHSLINSFLLYYVKEITTKLYAAIVNCSFCLLLSYLIIFKIVCCILLLDTIDIASLLNKIKDIIQIPMLFGLLSLSIILLIGTFKQTPQQIISDLQRLQKIQHPDNEIKESYINYSWEGKVSMTLKKLRLVYVSPILISGCYLALEYYCYAQLISELSKSQIDYQNIITFSGLLAAIPIFFVFGICIANSNTQIDSLYLWVPLLIGGALTFITVTIWNLTNQIEYIKQISGLIHICSLIISLIWLSVGYFRSERRNQKMFIMLLGCLFFAFPLGFLLTLSNGFEDYQITITTLILISFGFLPLIGVIAYYTVVIVIYLLKLPQQAKTFNFQAYQHINLNSYAHWINSIGYIVGFYFLCHIVWNEPSTATTTKKGTIQGLLVVHTLLFILTNYALQIKVIRQPLETKQKENYYRYLERIKSMTTIWSVISFVILFPLSLTREDEIQKTAILLCAIAIPIIFQYLRFLSYIKQTPYIYKDFTQPLVIIFMWILIIGPIGIIFPIISNLYETSSEDFAVFAQIAVAYSIFVVILIVTGASIFYSVLLNKEFLEMKKKEVLTAVIQKLVNNQVQATEEVCSLIFMRYIQKQDPIKIKEELKEGTIVNVIKYEGKEKELELELLSKEDYDDRKQIERQRIKSQRGKSISKPQSDTDTIQDFNETLPDVIQNPGLWVQIQDLLQDLLTCTYGQKQLLNLENNQKQQEIDNASIESWKNSKLETQKNLPEIFLKNLQKNDFYCALLKNVDRTERFWCAIHSKFSENFEIVLEYLGLISDDQILSQYESYHLSNDKFQIKISLSDFAQIMKDNTPETQPKYQYLWELSIKMYPIFLYNFPDLKHYLKKTHSGSPFNQQKYEENGKVNIKQIKGLQQIEGNQEYIEKEYQNRKNIIDQRFVQNNPSEFKLKIWKTCEIMHLWLWIKPHEIINKIVVNMVEKLSLKLSKIIPEEDKIERNPKWEKISQDVGDLIVKKCSDFDKKMKSQQYKFKISVTNILAVLSKIFNWYSLATLAFSTEVGWQDEQEFDPITTVDYSAIWSNYDLFFSLAFVISIAYIILGIQANKQIQNNTFGYNSQGEVATMSDLNFYISKLISIISGQFIFVMKTFIDAFMCDYNSYPYKVMRQPSVECMSSLHFMYGLLALIGCGLFYPLSTFLQPAFQYSDHSLDLKYKSSYVALFIQAELLLLGLSTVFSNLHESAYLYQMLFSSFVMALLIFAYHKLQPCYITWFNKVEICFLFLLCYFYFAAFLIMATKTKLVGVIFLTLCSSITTPYYGYHIYKYYRQNQHHTATNVIKIQHLEESQQITQGNV